VSFGTAQRSITLLRKWNMVKVQSGCRTVVLPLPEDSRGTVVAGGTVGEATGQVVDGADQRRFFNREVVHLGQVLRTMRAEVNPEDGSQLRRFLSEAIVRLGRTEDRIGEYELNVCRIGEPQPMITFVTTAA
jgi:hypothetical protein